MVDTRMWDCVVVKWESCSFDGQNAHGKSGAMQCSNPSQFVGHVFARFSFTPNCFVRFCIVGLDDEEVGTADPTELFHRSYYVEVENEASYNFTQKAIMSGKANVKEED